MKLEIEFNPKYLIEFYNKGLEDGFMLANEGKESDLEETLNVNNIDEANEDEPI
jgi:hypothetical protein